MFSLVPTTRYNAPAWAEVLRETLSEALSRTGYFLSLMLLYICHKLLSDDNPKNSSHGNVVIRKCIGWFCLRTENSPNCRFQKPPSRDGLIRQNSSYCSYARVNLSMYKLVFVDEYYRIQNSQVWALDNDNVFMS